MIGAVLRAAAAARAHQPTALSLARQTGLPFVPTDWVFRFFPFICRDRVRFLYRFNQISFFMGLGYFYLWCHTPFACTHYEGFWESPYYRYVKWEMYKTGELEENLRIK